MYVYERDEFKQNLFHSWISLYRQIQKENFDLVFDFSLNSSFGFFSFACGIKQRIGYDYHNRGRFLTGKINLKGYESKHVADY